MSDSDSSVVGGDGPARIANPAPVRRQSRPHRQSGVTEGPSQVVLVIAAEGAPGATWFAPAQLSRAGMARAWSRQVFGDSHGIVGRQLVGAAVCRWQMVPWERRGQQTRCEQSLFFSRFPNSAGAILYMVLEGIASVYRLSHAAPVDVTDTAATVDGRIGDLPGVAGGVYTTYGDWVRRVSPAGALRIITATLCPSMALAVVRGSWQMLRGIPLTKIRVPWKLLLPGGPTKHMVRSFVRALPEHPQGAQRNIRHRLRNLARPSAYKAEVWLEWIDVSAELKQLRRFDIAAEKWGKIIARHIGQDPNSILRGLPTPPFKQLCRARVRLDTAAMQLWRVFFEQTSLNRLALYLWIDSSPQRKGIEFLHTSWDVFLEGSFKFRRKLPAVHLARELFTARGKAVALLWQVFLMVGPYVDQIYSVLKRIRAITTDMGVESQIKDTPDFVLPFLRSLGVSIPRSVRPKLHLLPYCVQLSGWKHKTDLWIKRGLSSLRYFPHFLVRVKAVVAFVRDSNMLDSLVLWLREHGRGFAADILQGLGLRSFAAWRWGTLASVLREMEKWMSSFLASFSAEPFRRVKDRAGVQTIAAMQADARWPHHFRFTCWYMKHLDAMQQVGGTCWCHRELYERGEALPVC